MENASKALIMAASILLSVMILSIGVYLFSTLGQYGAEIYEQIENDQINQFNTQFLKYYGERINEKTNKPEVIKCTAHDIISLANLAKQNNIDKELEDSDGTTDSTIPDENWTNEYIRIDMGNKNKNLEKLTSEQQIKFIQDNSTDEVLVTVEGERKLETQTKYFKCIDVVISTITKKVCYMKFIEI